MIKWKYKPNGNVPVQAEGYFKGHYFYFRARWKHAKIEFSKTEKDWEDNNIVAHYQLFEVDDEYSAGWLPKWFCRVLIWWGCIKFMFKRKSNERQNLD